MSSNLKSKAALVLAALFGHNATKRSIVLVIATATIGAWCVLKFSSPESDTTFWSQLGVALIAFDLIGGAVSNLSIATSLHYQATTFFRRVAFFLGHIAQPLAYAYLVGGSVVSAVLLWLYAMVAGVSIMRSPKGFQLEVGAAASVLGFIVFGSDLLEPIGGSWFAPVYLLKLLIGFSVDHRRLN